MLHQIHCHILNRVCRPTMEEQGGEEEEGERRRGEKGERRKGGEGEER